MNEPFAFQEQREQHNNVTMCINLCETVGYGETAWDIEKLLNDTCLEAGFPGCERLYVGSYVCENFFLGLPDSFHETIAYLCARYDMKATLVVPIFGQAFLERGERRLADVLARFNDTYDEVVVNDVAEFFFVRDLCDKRIGLGRLLLKEQRDARYPDLMERTAHPTLSTESLECIAAGGRQRPLVEIDPVCQAIDVSVLLDEAPTAEIAIHLPYCLATTGRNCGPASAMEHPDEKFRLGRGCSKHCLRMHQGCTTDAGIEYVKHGRAYYFANTDCSIAGTSSWRILYAVTHGTMR